MTGTFELRHLADAGDVDFFNAIPYALNHEVADDLEQRRRRPEWTWLAVCDGRLLGRLSPGAQRMRRSRRSSTYSTSTSPSPTNNAQ